MKRNIKRIVVFLLCFITLFSTVGCVGPGDEDNFVVDTTKTQLRIGNIPGGYGSEWLYALIDRFEKDYAETSFEPGKKGVQCRVEDANKQLIGTMPNSTIQVYFSEYIYVYDLIAAGVLLDITDVVTDELTEFGEDKSIKDKLTAEQDDFLRTSDNKYYAVPHYAGLHGITYDMDLFDEKKLYFAKNGAPSEALQTGGSFSSYKFTNYSDVRSAGPDGIYDTYDDGLPATYDEFFAMCDRMVAQNVTPFAWSGKYMDMYFQWFMDSLKVDYEGLEQTMLNFNLSGTATTLVDSIDSNGNITFKNPTTINRQNAYLLYKQAGTYNALKFIERIIGNHNYYNSTYSFGSATHLDIQKYFIESSYDSYYEKPFAMLIEGIWWENEANSAFKEMETIFPNSSRLDRNFGYMPMPKATLDAVGTKRTVSESHYSFAFINSNIKDNENLVKLSKLFLKYANTDVSLSEFTEVSSAPKALKYTLRNSDNMSTFAKSVFSVFNNENTDIVYSYSKDAMYLSNQDQLLMMRKFNVPNVVVGLEMKNNGKSAKTLFEDLSSYYNQSYWNTKYGQFFNA